MYSSSEIVLNLDRKLTLKCDRLVVMNDYEGTLEIEGLVKSEKNSEVGGYFKIQLEL